MGTAEFVTSYVQNKASLCGGEIENLSEIAVTQLCAAYMAFYTCAFTVLVYIAQMVPMATNLFHPLDDLSLCFLPAVTG